MSDDEMVSNGNVHIHGEMAVDLEPGAASVINMVVEGKVLPPADPLACQICGVRHDPDLPHNRDQLHYQYAFYHDNMRWPTWSDAMLHCAPEIQEHWLRTLEEMNVPHDQIYAEL